MSSKPSKPTILISPGSFSHAYFYDDTVKQLKADGFDTFVYTHPSDSRKPPEHAATLEEDVMFLSGVLTALCEAGRDVVVLGHSYGGLVASQGIKSLTEKRPGKGRVIGLIYLTALAPLEGESLLGLMSGAGAETGFMQTEGEFLYHHPHELSASVCFSDLPLEEGVKWVAQMPYHSATSFTSPLTYAGYKDVDSIAYILCTRDKCLVPDFQKQMIENLKSGGRPVKVYELAADHCVPASQVEKLVETVETAMKQFV